MGWSFPWPRLVRAHPLPPLPITPCPSRPLLLHLGCGPTRDTHVSCSRMSTRRCMCSQRCHELASMDSTGFQ